MSTIPDDPRLTSYALGELDGEERAAIESLLADSEPVRRFVADVRATSAVLRQELALEPAPGLDDARRAAILSEETEPVGAIRLHVDDAEERTDVYHVITHPGPGARRYRAELLAIAAAVAIVATALTLILSSVFRGHGPANSSVASSTSPTTPQIPFIFAPGSMTVDKTPVVPDGFTSHPPRELIAQMPADRDGPALPFGVTGAISVTPIQMPTTVPTTGESGGTVGAYALTIENPFFDAGRNPLSSFSFNVGNGSYAAVRRALAQQQLPAKDAVRIEQLVNYFPYHYAAPANGETFAAHIEVAACPWQGKHRLVRIGLKGKELAEIQPIAEDLQIRVEFNPARVGAYRLIGYDCRMLTRAVSIEGGKRNQVKAGQSVTALYEIIPAGAEIPADDEPLKYQKPPELTAAARGNELLTVQLRYTDPLAASASKSQVFAAADPGAASPQPSDDFKFAAAVAGFGLLLRDSPHKGDATYDIVLALAESGQHSDALGERAKFLDLIRQAQRI